MRGGGEGSRWEWGSSGKIAKEGTVGGDEGKTSMDD